MSATSMPSFSQESEACSVSSKTSESTFSRFNFAVSKKLSKLNFVDTKQGSHKGVSTDIKKGWVTVYLKPDAKADVAAMKEAVESGGYDVVQIYLNEDNEVKAMLT